MEHPRTDLGTIGKREIIGGLLYLPMLLFGSQFLAVLLVSLLGENLPEGSQLAASVLVFEALNAAVLGAIFLRYLADQFRRLQARGWSLFPDLLLGILLYYGLSFFASFVINVLLTIFGVDYSNANQEAIEAAAASSALMTLLAACVLGPLAEELFLRGLVFCGLYRKSRLLAYALSMFLFSLFHVYSSVFNQSIGLTLVNLAIYLPGGFVLAWIYERSGSIWSSVFLHMMMNAIALALQGVMR